MELVAGAWFTASDQIALNSTRGGQIIAAHLYLGNFTGLFWAGLVSLSHPDLSFPCASTTLSSSPLYPSGHRLECVLSPGVGKDLVFNITLCAPSTGVCVRIVELHAFRFHYPAPYIKRGSLREYGQPESGILILRTEKPVRIAFDGGNFGPDPHKVLVAYGPLEEPDRFACQVQEMSTDNTIVCDTQANSFGLANIFLVNVSGQAALSETSDYISFQFEAPEVHSVSGCEDDPGATAARGCPTRGGLMITIRGVRFTPPLMVFVSGETCLPLLSPNTSFIECQLPEGTGADQPVIVSANSLLSAQVRALSYAKPTITAVEGCTPNSEDTRHAINCNRTGGDRITIRGSNFGPRGARVRIGSESCLEVRHNETFPHETLTCILPSGTRARQPLLVLPNNGGENDPGPAVSYVPSR